MIKEENLLFLISQPRSGSSLLQQLLINTKQVASVPEPWFMLPLIETFRQTDNQAGYNPYYAHVNFMEYLNRYSGAKSFLKEEIKNLALKLYNLNELNDKEIFFLDKTPRYYHIVDELKELFPAAKFIFLIRNPISVFASILEYNFKGDIYKIFKDDRQHDLITAPQKISNILFRWEDKDFLAIRYEDLVAMPNETFKKVGHYLGIKTSEKNLTYHVDEVFLNARGIDRKSVIANTEVNKEYLDSWRKSINNYQKKSLLKTYIDKVGAETITTLGYDYDKVIKTIENHKVTFKLPFDYTYLLNKGQDIGFLRFLSTRINQRLNNIFRT